MNKVDSTRSIELLSSLLVGCAFTGFSFDTSFSLFFSREFGGIFDDKPLPPSLRLDILEDWWLGDEQEWSKYVAKNGTGIEPDEPVKAYELSKLRWSKGAFVDSIAVDDKSLVLIFQNGVTLHLLLTGEDEFAYQLYDCIPAPREISWSVTLDTSGIHLRAP